MKEPPYNFSWVIPKKLAACAAPSRLRRDLEYLTEQSIGLIISLTVESLNKVFLDEFGIEYKHIPIRDFAPPTPGQIDDFVAAIDDAMKRDVKALVHCHMGYGRTGTLLAAYFVHQGESAEYAIIHIRRLRPGSIETDEQEQSVYDYEARLNKHKGPSHL
jgi:atypical dual specificity phosphatase